MNFELLKSKGKSLSKAKMKNIKGGYSWLWCLTHSIDIKIGSLVIYDAPVGDNGMTWEECRRAK